MVLPQAARVSGGQGFDYYAPGYRGGYFGARAALQGLPVRRGQPLRRRSAGPRRRPRHRANRDYDMSLSPEVISREVTSREGSSEVKVSKEVLKLKKDVGLKERSGLKIPKENLLSSDLSKRGDVRPKGVKWGGVRLG